MHRGDEVIKRTEESSTSFFLPRINPGKNFEKEQEYRKQLQVLKDRKKTIKVFIKKTDLEYVDRKDKNRKDLIQREISKAASLKDIQVAHSKTKEKNRSRKIGVIYSNEFWSDKYYQKVMKYTHLQRVFDFMKEEKRHKTLEKNQLISNRIDRDSIFAPSKVLETREEDYIEEQSSIPRFST